jgi:hypothetical protein
LMACLVVSSRACARACPIVQTASDALLITPSVAALGLDPLDVEVVPEERAEISGQLLVTFVGGQCVEQHSPPCVTAKDSARLRHRPQRSQVRKNAGSPEALLTQGGVYKDPAVATA